VFYDSEEQENKTGQLGSDSIFENEQRHFHTSLFPVEPTGGGRSHDRGGRSHDRGGREGPVLGRDNSILH